jgi:hypothetical protein
MFAAFLIPIRLRRPPGGLQELVLPKIKDAFRKQLVRGGLSDVTVLGGVDFSFNVDSASRWQPHWQPHIQIVATGCSPAKFLSRIRDNYPTDGITSRPVWTSEVQNPVSTISYLLKPYFSRRVSYTDDHGQANTRKCGLKPAQLREIAVFMDRHEITDRLILQNLRRYGGELIPTTSRVRESVDS